ncbi:MAG: sugar phosphate isomerase/epimerase family protein [Microbacterium sp.]|uniref:sugar phosphate isomerase/epimerase family protein n=1 Tax=Microbacterium sp. TaxID=51671 RepID=UPI003F8073C8
MLKLSFSTLGTPAYSVDQIIQLATGSGYDGVELRALNGSDDLLAAPEFQEARLESTLAAFRDAGLTIPCVDTGVLVGTGPGDAFAAQLDEARAFARLASRLESPLIRIFAGPHVWSDDVPALYPGIAQSLRILADEVAAFGVTAAIETHGSLSRSADLLEVFSHGVGENIGVVWDVMHTYRNGETLEDSYAGLERFIRHVHLRDAAGMDPAHHDYVRTGDGIMPIAETIALLESGSFDGYVSFEWVKMWVPELEEPEVVVPQFASYVAQFRRPQRH